MKTDKTYLDGNMHRFRNSTTSSRLLKRSTRYVDGISAGGAGLCGVMLCIGLALIVVEIILRSALRGTLFITEEYSGYLMSAITFCGLAYTLREKGHIRVTLLHKAISERTRLHLDFLCYLIGFVFSMFLTYVCAQTFWDSVVTGSQSMQISETYLAIPQFFMPLGSLLLTLQFFAEILKSLLILKGDTAGITIHEEAEELGR